MPPVDAIIPSTPVKQVVFLDFDGVLNNYATFAKGHKVPHGPGFVRGLDPENVALFVQWLTQPDHEDLRVVVSSSWRLYSEWPDLVARMVAAGIPEDRIVGRTREIPDPYDGVRGREICKWLEAHSDRHGSTPDVVIVDDLPPSVFVPLEAQLVHTSDMTGFNERAAEEATAKLKASKVDWLAVVRANTAPWSLR